jgi:hypothetical protein
MFAQPRNFIRDLFLCAYSPDVETRRSEAERSSLAAHDIAALDEAALAMRSTLERGVNESDMN